MKYFDIENTKRIKFSDFGKAFLPNNRDFSLKILTRPAKNLKRERPLNEVFNKQTLVQYMILWRIILRQIWEIENKKKQYCQANCYDAERAFFDIDTVRKGHVDLENVRYYNIPFFLFSSNNTSFRISKINPRTRTVLSIQALKKRIT